MALSLALVLDRSRAFGYERGLGDMLDPVASWLARAPASCIVTYARIDGESETLMGLPEDGHVAYWIGHAMDRDDAAFHRYVNPYGGHWSGQVVTSSVWALYDARHHISKFEIGAGAAWGAGYWRGAFAEQPPPPADAPAMRADLSGVFLGGNVRLGDSLATVTHSLGLRTLVPTRVQMCSGRSVVEVCSWNKQNCACPGLTEAAHATWQLPPGSTRGVIVFRNARVIGLLWESQCV